MDYEKIRELQQDLPLGRKVLLMLNNGKDIEGVLIEISMKRLVIHNGVSNSKIPINRIEGYSVLDVGGTVPPSREGVNNEKPILKRQALVKEIEENVKEGKVKGQEEEPEMEKVPSAKVYEISHERKMFEIEQKFANISHLKIEPYSPDFEGINLIEDKTLKRKLESVKAAYDHAVKVHELGNKYGRIQNLINKLIVIIEAYPKNDRARSWLGYFRFVNQSYSKAFIQFELANTYKPSLKYQRDAAILAFHATDYKNAFYFFEKLFKDVNIDDYSYEWLLFIKLSLKCTHFSSIIKSITFPCLTGEDYRLQTLIFLIFKYRGRDEAMEALNRKGNMSHLQACNNIVTDFPLKDSNDDIANFISKKNLSLKQYVPPLKIQKIAIPEAPLLSVLGDKLEKKQKGKIYSYERRKGIGKIKAIGIAKSYIFFHITGVVDHELKNNLSKGHIDVDVEFEIGKGLRYGSVAAVQIRQLRTPKQLMSLAKKYNESGKYNEGIHYVKQVIETNPSHKTALKLYATLREMAKKTGLPKGSGIYARAKRAQILGDNESAIALFKTAIEGYNNRPSAIKDLSSLYAQLDRTEDAIELLENHKNDSDIKDKSKIDNLLIAFYRKNKNFNKTIELLYKKLRITKSKDRQISYSLQIGNANIQESRYDFAENMFRTVIDTLDPNNLMAKKNLAYALTKQRKYREAKVYLTQALEKSLDIEASELLEQVELALANNAEVNFELIKENNFLDSGDIVSDYCKFELNRIDLRGLVTRPGAIEEESNEYVEEDYKQVKYDLDKAIELARSHSTKRPKRRAEYYLMASKILHSSEGNLNDQFKFLGTALFSLGNDAAENNARIDCIRQYYIEAASVIDKAGYTKMEKDANDCLVNYIYATYNASKISPANKGKPIKRAIDEVINLHNDINVFFDIISQIIFISDFAEKKLLYEIYRNHTTRNNSLNYFKSKQISVDSTTVFQSYQNYLAPWNALKKRYYEKFREVISGIRTLFSFSIQQAWLSEKNSALNTIVNFKVLNELDRNRLNNIKDIFTTGLRYCQINTYNAQNRYLENMLDKANVLKDDVQRFPTKISIEQLFPLIEIIINKVEEAIDLLYGNTLPILSIELPSSLTFIPNDKEHIELQLKVSNEEGRSSAQEVTLDFKDSGDFSGLLIKNTTYRLTEVVDGGETEYFIIPIGLAKSIINKGVFSFEVDCKYKTVRNEEKVSETFSIQVTLGQQQEYQHITNPYKVGAIVEERHMFYGRDKLIGEVVEKMEESTIQGKAYLLYGQKRTGKSSVLFYLKEELEKNPDNVVVYIENIGSIVGEEYMYQSFLWEIVKKVKKVLVPILKSKKLKIKFPKNKEFTMGPTYLSYFNDIFDEFNTFREQNKSLQNKKIIILIDEFTYFYELIKKGFVPNQLMTNFKAFLQKNYFNAVLIGQDFAVKFIENYQNQFAAIDKKKISYLATEDAEKLIQEPILINGETRYRDEDAIKQIMYLTAGNPFYLQRICREIVEYLNETKTQLITGAIIKQIKDRLIKSPADKVLPEADFDNLYNSEDASDDAITQEDAKKVLFQIAKNSKTGSCSKGAINCETEGSLDDILYSLKQRDVIEKDRDREDYYKIKVGLYKEWLIANYHDYGNNI